MRLNELDAKHDTFLLQHVKEEVFPPGLVALTHVPFGGSGLAAMFKSMLLKMLDQHAGNVFKDVDKSSLKVSVLKGDIMLHNLRLNEKLFEAIDEFPFELVYGRVHELELHIPWTNLMNKPIQATARNVEVLLRPRSRATRPEDQEAQRKAEAATKRARHQQAIAALELLDEAQHTQSRFKAQGSRRAKKTPSKLASRIKQLFELQVSGIHVRIEVGSSTTGSSAVPNEAAATFAVGVLLKRFTIGPVNAAKGNASAEHAATRLVDIDGLAIYCDPALNGRTDVQGRPVSCGTDIEIERSFESMRNLSLFNSSYLLEPLSARCELFLMSQHANRTNNLASPRREDGITHTVRLTTAGIEGRASLRQLQCIAALIALADVGILRQGRLATLKPSESKKHRPRLWWKFAVACVLEARRLRRSIDPWRKLIVAVRDRALYVEGYMHYIESSKTILVSKDSTRLAEEKLRLLEDRLTPAEVVCYRRTATNELHARERRPGTRKAARATSPASTVASTTAYFSKTKFLLQCFSFVLEPPNSYSVGMATFRMVVEIPSISLRLCCSLDPHAGYDFKCRVKGLALDSTAHLARKARWLRLEIATAAVSRADDAPVLRITPHRDSKRKRSSNGFHVTLRSTENMAIHRKTECTVDFGFVQFVHRAGDIDAVDFLVDGIASYRRNIPVGTETTSLQTLRQLSQVMGTDRRKVRMLRVEQYGKARLV